MRNWIKTTMGKIKVFLRANIRLLGFWTLSLVLVYFLRGLLTSGTSIPLFVCLFTGLFSFFFKLVDEFFIVFFDNLFNVKKSAKWHRYDTAVELYEACSDSELNKSSIITSANMEQVKMTGASTAILVTLFTFLLQSSGLQRFENLYFSIVGGIVLTCCGLIGHYASKFSELKMALDIIENIKKKRRAN